jgi:hypothetical protein
MGPELLLDETADGLRWAQHVPSVKLSMVWNGPRMSPQIHCLWFRMGPQLSLGEIADGLRWAQLESSVTLLMVLNGPGM